MMTTSPDKIFCRHPDPEKAGTNIDKDKYDAMRKALLKHIPKRKAGVPFQGMKAAVSQTLPKEIYAGASVSWFLTTVKLDLEARGLIERVPGVSPQHMRRC